MKKIVPIEAELTRGPSMKQSTAQINVVRITVRDDDASGLVLGHIGFGVNGGIEVSVEGTGETWQISLADLWAGVLQVGECVSERDTEEEPRP